MRLRRSGKGEKVGKEPTRPMETWVLRCKLYPKQRRGETYGLPDRFMEAAGTREQLRV